MTKFLVCVTGLFESFAPKTGLSDLSIPINFGGIVCRSIDAAQQDVTGMVMVDLIPSIVTTASLRNSETLQSVFAKEAQEFPDAPISQPNLARAWKSHLGDSDSPRLP